MKAKVYSIEGTEAGSIELPEVFTEAVRPDLISRAFLALRTRLLQTKYPDQLAGVRTSADYFGRRHKVFRHSINIGKARLPRLKLPQGHLGEVRVIPQARKGREAHPPKKEKILIEKINDKERRKAIRSAIAATANIDFVTKRGHKVTVALPIVVEDKLESVLKTKDMRDILAKLKLGADLERAETKTKKAGQGKLRGRVYRRKTSVLIVVNEDKGVVKAAKNIPGVEAVLVKNLNAQILAPGGNPGRLVVYSESSVKSLKNLFK